MFRAILGNRFIPSSLGSEELIPDEALTMANLLLGRHGSGKSMAGADQIATTAERHPEDIFIIIEWSGSLSDALFKIILSDPKKQKLVKRLVYDPLGGRMIDGVKYITPLPEFAKEYDPEMNFRERVAHQAARVTRNFERANDSAAARNPSAIGRPITKVLPNLLEATYAIPDEHGEGFQITETNELLNDEKRAAVIDKYGGRVPSAKKYFEDHFPKTARQREFKTDVIADLLTIVEHDSTRARLGFHRPGWTPNEAIEKGQIVTIDGSGLMTREAEQDYLFTQVFSLFMAEIDKRKPGGDYGRIHIILDEAYSLLQVAGVAKVIARLPSQYRNRRVCLYVMIQTLNQLAKGFEGQPGLRDNIWSFGNIVCFSLLDFEDCKETATQFFPFNMHAEKLPATTNTQHPVMLNDAEQHTNWAYRIQHFRSRECLVRRFLSENRMDDRIRYVPKTREVKITVTDQEVERLKDELVLARGVEIAAARQVINKRQDVINELVEGLRQKKKKTKKRKVG